MHILLVEDSATNRSFLQNALSSQIPNLKLTAVGSLKETLQQAEANSFDVILLDLFLPDSESLETVERVIERVPKTPIVVLTGLEDEKVGLEAIHKGAQDYLMKNQYDPSLLLRIIKYAIERKKLMNELQEALDNIKTLKRLIPIFFHCKKIRNDKGFWDKLETYIKARSNAEFTHGLCPDCFQKEMNRLNS